MSAHFLHTGSEVFHIALRSGCPNLAAGAPAWEYIVGITDATQRAEQMKGDRHHVPV